MNRIKNTGLAIALLAAGGAAYAFTAPGDDGHKVKVKIIKIVDGDTTVTEKTVDESELPTIDQEVKEVKGKNVKVMMYVNSDEKEGKNKEEKVTINKNFSFDFDSLAKTCKIELNIDSLLNIVNGNLDFTVISSGDEEGDRHNEKKVIINGPGNGRSSFNFSFDTDSLEKEIRMMKDGDGEENNIVIITSPGQENGKKVIVKSSVTVIDDHDKGDNKKKEKKERGDDLKFYPNPSDGKFNIEADLESKETAVISVSDMNGKVLFRDEVKNGGHYSKQVDLGNGGKGTFILNLQQGKKSISRKIIIE